MIPGIEETCEACGGEGKQLRGGQCDGCRGRGSVPNDEGKAFLEFLRHHLDDEYGELLRTIYNGLSDSFEYRRSRDDD